MSLLPLTPVSKPFDPPVEMLLVMFVRLSLLSNFFDFSINLLLTVASISLSLFGITFTFFFGFDLELIRILVDDLITFLLMAVVFLQSFR